MSGQIAIGRYIYPPGTITQRRYYVRSEIAGVLVDILTLWYGEAWRRSFGNTPSAPGLGDLCRR